MAVLIHQKRRDMLTVGSGFYIGPAGTGKTYALRNEVDHVINNTDEIVFVINKRGEFDALVEEYDGLTIDVAKHPFHPLLILGANKIKKEEFDFLTKLKGGLVKLLITGKLLKLSNLQKYLIDQAIEQTYIEYKNPDWSHLVLTFEKMIKSYKDNKVAEKIQVLKDSLLEIAKDLNLSRLQTDSLLLKDTFLEELELIYDAVVQLGTIVSGKDQQSIEGHRLIIYDLKNLPSEDLDKYTVLAVEDVLTRLNGDDPIKKARLCIDDADKLFKHYDKYMSMLYKMSKTLGLVITSVINNTDIFLSKKSVFRNASSYYELYSQSDTMAEVIRPLFNLNDEEVDWIKNAPRGQKLVSCAGNKFLIKALN